MASIKIETGLKTYDIEDENGNILGQISFNPADENIIKRAQEASDNIKTEIEKVSTLNTINSEEDFIKIMSDIDTNIRKQINYMFDSDVSSIVFGSQSVLNTLNGKTFVERFLDAFIPIIKAEFNKEMKKSKQRIEKYTKRIKQ